VYLGKQCRVEAGGDDARSGAGARARTRTRTRTRRQGCWKSALRYSVRLVFILFIFTFFF